MSFVRSRRRGRLPHEHDSNSEDEADILTSDQDISSDQYDDSEKSDDEDEDETSEDDDEGSSSEEGESEDEEDVVSAFAPSSLEKEPPPSATAAKTTIAIAVSDERKTAATETTAHADGGVEKLELTEREKQILRRHEYRRRQAATEDPSATPDVGPSFIPYAGQFWSHDNRYRQETMLPPNTTEDPNAAQPLPLSDVGTTTTPAPPSGTGGVLSLPPTIPPPRRRRQNNFRRVPEEVLNSRWTHDGYEELMRLEEREEQEGRAHKDPLPTRRQNINHTRPSTAQQPQPQPQQRRPTKRIEGASKEWQQFDGGEGAWPNLSTTTTCDHQHDKAENETTTNSSTKKLSLGAKTVAGAGDGDGDGFPNETGQGERVELIVGEKSSSRQHQDADEILDWSETGTWSATKTGDWSLSQKNRGGGDYGTQETDEQKPDDDEWKKAAETSGWSTTPTPVVETGGDSGWKKASLSTSPEKTGWGNSVEKNGNGKAGFDISSTGSAENVSKVATPADGWSSSVSQTDDDDGWKRSGSWAQDGSGWPSAAHGDGGRNRVPRRGGEQEGVSRLKKHHQQEQPPRGERTSSKWRKEPPTAENTCRPPKQPTPKSEKEWKPKTNWSDERQKGDDNDWKKAATWMIDVDAQTTTAVNDEWPVETEKELSVPAPAPAPAPAQQQRPQQKRTTRGYLSQKKPTSPTAAAAAAAATAAAPLNMDAPAATTTGNVPPKTKRTEGEAGSLETESKPPVLSAFTYSFDAEPWKPTMAPRDDARGHERFIEEQEEQEEQESDVEIILEADTLASNSRSEVGIAATPPIISNPADTAAGGGTAAASTPTYGTPRPKHQRDLGSDWRRRDRPTSEEEDQQVMLQGSPFFYPSQQQMGYLPMAAAQPPPYAMPMQAIPMPVGSEAGRAAGVGSSASAADQENQYLPSGYEANGMVYYSMDSSAVYPYYYYAPMPVMVPAGPMPPNGGEELDEGWGPAPDQTANEGESDWQADKLNRNSQLPSQSPAYSGPFYYYPSSQYYT